MTERKHIAAKEDWENHPMPAQNAVFTIKRRFTKKEIDHLKSGHIPEEMEDKWFSYFEDNKLYIHRSWTGICIYIVEFDSPSNFIAKFKANRHRVIVNRDENQYSCTDIEEDIREVGLLLDFLSL